MRQPKLKITENMDRPRLPKRRATSHTSRGRKTSDPRKSRAKQKKKQPMTKTTRKGAYAKNKKKQMSIRRAPLVETFKYQSAPEANETLRLSRTTAYNNIMNRAFIAGYVQNLDVPNDGLSTDGTITPFVGPTCRGRDIYSKMTAMKMRFEFPENIHSIRTAYQPPIVYWGWIKDNAFRTNAMTPAPSAINEEFFKDLIDHQLLAQFNEANDRLDFRDKRPTQYKIIGKRKIVPKLDENISKLTFQSNVENVALPIDADDVTPLPGGNRASGEEPMTYLGSLPPVYHTCKWPVNRKIGLQRTTSWMGTGTNERFYPADCWIPFCFVFNPSFANQINSAAITDATDHGQIQVSWNSVHYYTDS